MAKRCAMCAPPPTGPMLTRALIAAQFQDTDEAGEVNDGTEDRTFIRFAEDARNGLTPRGVAVDRIYADEPNTNPPMCAHQAMDLASAPGVAPPRMVRS